VPKIAPPAMPGPTAGIPRSAIASTAVLSFASMLATDLELPATTLAQLVGHADAGFTLKVYARDGRDTATVVSDVLDHAERAGIR
jgi:hypothetical protein